MIYHYEWDNTEEDSALVTYNLMQLLQKLNVGFTYVNVTQSHVCDTCITVHYKNRPRQKHD